MKTALRLIETNGVPPVVVNANDIVLGGGNNSDADDETYVQADDDDDDDDDDGEDDELEKDMKNIVVIRPLAAEVKKVELPAGVVYSNPASRQHILPVEARRAAAPAAPAAPAASPDAVTAATTTALTPEFQDVDLTNENAVIAVLTAASGGDKHEHWHAQALRAEVDFRRECGGGEAASPSQRDFLAVACKASTQINTALIKYRKLTEWKTGDIKKEILARNAQAAVHSARLHKEEAAQKRADRQHIQRFINAWKSIVERYLHMLRKANTHLRDIIADRDAKVVGESIRVAADLVAAIGEILEESLARVQAVDDPEDVLRLLSVLHHAITDSTAGVERVLADAIGVRPDFDDVRNQELEDALKKARADIARCEDLVAQASKTLEDPATTVGAMFTARQALAAAATRRDAAVRLETLLATDLQNAGVQRVILALHETCQSQVEWKELSAKLAAACDAALARLQEVYSNAHREQYTVEEVAHRTQQALEHKLQQDCSEMRTTLDGIVARAIAGVASAAEQTAPAPSRSRHDMVTIILRNLLSRVLLEYAML